MNIKNANIKDLLELKRELTINLNMAQNECNRTKCPKLAKIQNSDNKQTSIITMAEQCADICPNKYAMEKLFLLKQINELNHIIDDKINESKSR